MKVILVTIAIGDKYIEEYKNLFYESQKNYALKHNYDFKVITDFLDKEEEDKLICNICMNKFLLCSQPWSSDYDFIVYVDADILININSPPIHNYIDYENYIGVVDEYSQPTKERRAKVQSKMGWVVTATEYYELSGFDIKTDICFNGGMQVLQPKIHREFLENVYDKYIKKSKNHHRGFHFEQSCLGYELQKANLYKLLDNKFNAIWVVAKIDNMENISMNQYFKENYFIHFAAHVDYDKVKEIQKNNIL
jgi:hypothetical protein